MQSTLSTAARPIRYETDSPDYWFSSPHWKALQETLLCYGVSPTSTREAAEKYFLDWEPGELSAVLDKVSGLPRKLCTVKRSSWFRPRWVKAPPDLIAQAAENKLALCVNKSGEWTIRNEGFVALSHVWEEGLYGDNQNRGIPEHVLRQLFDILNPAQAEWIWLDSLSVPGGLVELSAAEERTKIDLINNLHSIYQNADTVVVLDALLLNLQSVDPLEVGAVLLCGKWKTRLWTYQEAKLANTVVLITSSGVVDFHDLVVSLGALCGYNAENGVMNDAVLHGPSSRKARLPYFALRSLLKWEASPVTLGNITHAWSGREASFDIDYSRALFPSLGHKWSERYSREDGMRVIFDSRKTEAMELLITWNSPRCIDAYGWAPTYLDNLASSKIGGLVWDSQGLRRSNGWFAYRVRAQNNAIPKPRNSPYCNYTVELDHGASLEYICGLELSQRERLEARDGFHEAIQTGDGYLLSPHPLQANPSKGDQTSIALLVSCTISSSVAQVFMTAQVRVLENIYEPKHVHWLIGHVSPLSSGQWRAESAFEKAMESSISPSKSNSGAVHENEGLIHTAVRSGDAQMLRISLPNSQEHENSFVNARDSQGWTPLATAAALGYSSLIEILLSRGVDINAQSKDLKTPLILAIEGRHTDAVRFLLDKGARTHPSHSPLVAALRSKASEIIVELLKRGYDRNGTDTQDTPAIFYADDEKCFCEMINSNANPLVWDDAGGRSLVGYAASRGMTSIIPKLVAAGVPVDVLDKGLPYNALFHAINGKHDHCVEELVQAQANVNRKYPGGLTPLILAAKIGSFETCSILLDAGAKLDHKDEQDGASPLSWAVWNGHARVVKLFLQRLAASEAWKEDTIMLTNNAGKTSLDLAKTRGNREVLRMFGVSGEFITRPNFGFMEDLSYFTIFAGVAGICALIMFWLVHTCLHQPNTPMGWLFRYSAFLVVLLLSSPFVRVFQQLRRYFLVYELRARNKMRAKARNTLTGKQSHANGTKEPSVRQLKRTTAAAGIDLTLVAREDIKTRLENRIVDNLDDLFVGAIVYIPLGIFVFWYIVLPLARFSWASDSKWINILGLSICAIATIYLTLVECAVLTAVIALTIRWMSARSPQESADPASGASCKADGKDKRKEPVGGVLVLIILGLSLQIGVFMPLLRHSADSEDTRGSTSGPVVAGWIAICLVGILQAVWISQISDWIRGIWALIAPFLFWISQLFF